MSYLDSIKINFEWATTVKRQLSFCNLYISFKSLKVSALLFWLSRWNIMLVINFQLFLTLKNLFLAQIKIECFYILSGSSYSFKEPQLSSWVREIQERNAAAVFPRDRSLPFHQQFLAQTRRRVFEIKKSKFNFLFCCECFLIL